MVRVRAKLRHAASRSTVPYSHLGDPNCYLCSLANNAGNFNITILDAKGLPPRQLSCLSPKTEEEDYFCMTMAQCDWSRTHELWTLLMDYYADPDDGKAQSEVMQQWPFIFMLA